MHPLAPTEPWEGGPKPGEDYPTDPAEKEAQLARLRAQLQSHPSKPAYYAWDAARRSFGIWIANARELRSVLLFAGRDQDWQLAVMHDGPEQDQLWASIDQRLLNMTAAALSLIEKTTKLATLYPGSEFASEYGTRRRSVEQAGVTNLIERLRHYLLHDGGYAPIRINSSMLHVNSPEFTVATSLYLETDRLLAEKTWFRRSDKTARAYLREHPEVPLLDLLEEHAQMVAALFQWAFAQHDGLEGANLDEVDDIRRQIRLTHFEGRNVEAEAREVFAASDAAKAAEAAEQV